MQIILIVFIIHFLNIFVNIFPTFRKIYAAKSKHYFRELFQEGSGRYFGGRLYGLCSSHNRQHLVVHTSWAKTWRWLRLVPSNP